MVHLEPTMLSPGSVEKEGGNPYSSRRPGWAMPTGPGRPAQIIRCSKFEGFYEVGGGLECKREVSWLYT